MARSAIDTRNTVNTPCIAYQEMAPHWDLPEALSGGTLAMRTKKENYLPRYLLEENTEYERRLALTVLYNAYGRTISMLAGMPFSQPVVVSGLPPVMDSMVQDADLTGRSLTNLAHDLLSDMLNYGKAHFLVAMPDVRLQRQEAGGQLSLEDEARLALRPYFVPVNSRNLIGWVGSRTAGTDSLSQVRIREKLVEQVPPFGQRTVNRVRVYTPTTIQLWREDPKTKQWTKEGEDIPNELGKIALVTVYARRGAFMVGYPVLEDLAFLNLRHWQSRSDQDNILHFARTYFLAFIGWDTEEISSVAVGTSRAVANRDTSARVEVVEHSGAAINAGQKDLADQEDAMRSMGAELVQPRPGARTATEREIELTENISDLQAMVRNLETGLEQGFELAAEWIGQTLPEDFRCDISEEFATTFNFSVELAELREDLKMGVIDRRTYLEERKRRGLYGEEVDIEAVLAAAETEAPVMPEPAPEPTTEELAAQAAEAAGQAAAGE